MESMNVHVIMETQVLMPSCVFQVIKNYLTGGFCGHDKEGSPIRVELYGHLDLKGNIP
jgi:hypothetical protein